MILVLVRKFIILQVNLDVIAHLFRDLLAAKASYHTNHSERYRG